jgi:hypothetical protein
MSERGVAEGANFLRDEANPAGPRRSEKTKPSGRTPTLGPETRAFAEPCNVKLSAALRTPCGEKESALGAVGTYLSVTSVPVTSVPRHLRPQMREDSRFYATKPKFGGGDGL